PRYTPVPLEAAWLKASVNAAALPALVDGRTDTYWTTTGPQLAGETIDIDLPAPVVLGRVELALGRRPFRYGSKLRLLVSDDGVEWRRLRVVPGRPPLEEQARPPQEAGQVLLPRPSPGRKIRVGQDGQGGRRVEHRGARRVRARGRTDRRAALSGTGVSRRPGPPRRRASPAANRRAPRLRARADRAGLRSAPGYGGLARGTRPRRAG